MIAFEHPDVQKFYRQAERAAIRFAIRHGYDPDECVSEAGLGVIAAAKKFDPQAGYQFNTFAWRAVNWKLARLRIPQFQKHRGLISLSKRLRSHEEYLGVILLEETLEAPPGPDLDAHAQLSLWLRELSPEQAYLIRRHWLEGTNYRELGLELQLNHVTVGRRVKEAARRLCAVAGMPDHWKYLFPQRARKARSPSVPAGAETPGQTVPG